MEELLSKKEIEEIEKIEGEVRGIALKNHAEFIEKEKGSQGLQLLEENLKTGGYPLEHQKIKGVHFYPIKLEVVVLVLAERLFNFDKEKFREIGKYGARVSLLIKPFLKYFVSLEKVAKEASKIWRDYYTVGDLEVTTLDKENKTIVVELKNFKAHPLHCLHLEGYFTKVVEMVVGRQISCEETKCVHRGDAFHRFLLKW